MTNSKGEKPSLLRLVPVSALALILSLPALSDPSRLTLERIFESDDFREESFGPARWLPDSSGYVVVEPSQGAPGGQDLVFHGAATGESRVLVASRHLVPGGEGPPLSIEDYQWSHDGACLLIYTSSKRVWRARTRGDYWVFDVNSRQLERLGGDAAPSTLMFATFSPVDHRVAYVRERNLYVEDWRNGSIVPLTSDGSEHVINGTFDWVYEEEFRLRNGFRWSPDGERIAYWQIDTREVGVFHLIDNLAGLYPRLIPIPYPKVGETNPSCRVGVVSSDGSSTRWIDVPGDSRDNYIAYLEWCDSKSLVLQQLNRLQNTNRFYEVVLAKASELIPRDQLPQSYPRVQGVFPGRQPGAPAPEPVDYPSRALSEVNEEFQRRYGLASPIVRNGYTLRPLLIDRDDAWVEVVTPVLWTGSKSAFLWSSEQDGWRHLYLGLRTAAWSEEDGANSGALARGDWFRDEGLPPEDALSFERLGREGGGEDSGLRLKPRQARLLTREEHDVIALEGIDEKRKQVYYIASPGNPTQRYLYRTPLHGGPAVRVTPENQPGTHSYQFSTDMSHAIHTWSSANRPAVRDLVSLPDHRRVRALTGNDELRKAWEELDRKPVEFFRVPVEDGVELDGWLVSPPRVEEGKKYPLLVFVYGEPAGQTVLDRWGGRRQLWHLMHAQNGYFVMSVDNRGTPAPRGRHWRKVVYRKVGVLAPRDQAAALDAVLARRPEIDPERVGVWGWSGGGSMTLNMMFKYPGKYAVGMSVAPVPNQRLYDTIYQERYMGLPKDNVEGFRDGSPIHFAAGLEGDLLLVHGTGDDNVHYQGTEALVDELVALKKPFTMMAYPNRSHAIREGVNTTPHLYQLLTSYLYRHLPAGGR